MYSRVSILFVNKNKEENKMIKNTNDTIIKNIPEAEVSGW
jgi:hypothetical protein